MGCLGFLQCTLKVLNFLLTLVGAGMVLYSLWALNQWYLHLPPQSEAPAPGFAPSSFAISDFSEQMPLGYEMPLAEGAVDELKAHPDQGLPELPVVNSGQSQEEEEEVLLFKRPLFIVASASKLTFSLFPKNLPAPWFIYAFLAAGVIVCLVTITGHIAAEIASACCLSCYTFFLGFLLVIQAAIAAAIFFDDNWYKDIPADPTGEMDKIREFVHENYDICKWITLGVVVVEVLGLLLAMVLRAASGAARKNGYDSDDDFLAPRAAARQPLLNRQAAPANGAPAAPAETRPARTDAWSTRMREKYGLDTTEFTYNPSESRRFAQQPTPSTEEKKGWCTVM